MIKTKEIQYGDFAKINIEIGTIKSAKLHTKSRISAYILEVEFDGIVKKSIAQLTKNYQPEDLTGKQIAAITNFPAKRIGGVKSELLVLAAVDAKKGSILLTPDFQTAECSKVY